MLVLITGANGQLGRAFQELFKEQGIDFIAATKEELDITNLQQIREFVRKNEGITHIINCAAYNKVDEAERDWKTAYLVNGIGPKNLAIVSNEIGAELVHYSTDYVFSGKKGSPYTIYDTSDPINKYGESKVLGERFVMSFSNRYYLIRTSWVFGDGMNFVRKVLEWSKKSKVLRIVDDEVSSPTYAPDLAKATWELIKLKAYGLYHITNSGYCSRYEWAEFILNEIGWDGELKRAKQEDFNLPAKRPKFSVLDGFGLREFTGMKMESWKRRTTEFIEKLGSDY
ncbi:dTDP-4-dehydrorhamnose reductase [Thermotoga neapolitana]|uniref:dTDP-4-dehydrorhamnose reductase n=2 Tax=Thermotogaceae TaxID=188709 RepID=B9KB15_THENN|nr:dTDP-4-dehydrorhamnose reductase [Thermotoga neapolitana]ACM22211.1 Putative dTDP-4-dehydrorhamnose reductase [Thermotoga neapolitana DSM 4359]KFZ20935.1 dTDP-4-dehydrorhamnose reductase [Thermotoga neapolitana LA10]